METIDYFIQQRGRAWRRKQKYLYRGRNCGHTLDTYKPEKKWKNLYSRSLKLARARQLKIEYPRIPNHLRKYQAAYDYWTVLI